MISTMLMPYIYTILIVGIVTGGLQIRFDRFFVILLLLFIFKMPIKPSIDIYLWVIMLGAGFILFMNRAKIMQMPSDMKKKFFIVIPIFTAIATWIGTWVYERTSDSVLYITLAVLAVLYGLRLIAIHFEEHELAYEDAHPSLVKLCGLLGPWISGFMIGFIGTSIKALKIPLGIKVFKMNAKQIYVGNAASAFFASAFAIIWHALMTPGFDSSRFVRDSLLGIALFVGIHLIFAITNKVFPDKWRKAFQIFIGLALLAAAYKVYILA